MELLQSHELLPDFCQASSIIVHMSQAKLLITGRVQGVFYRHSTREKARELGLRGWVRNLPDGRVEALAVGDRAKIEALINWCKIEPPSAHVEGVAVDWQEESTAADIAQDFEVR